MPYSSFVFDDATSEIIKFIHPRTFLDLGAGAGKYGSLVKEIDSSIKTTGIEVEKDYLEKFNLHKIYDQVWNISISHIIHPKYFDLTFDVVMAGDILEHLKKSEGIDILNFLIYRCRWIIVEFPDRYLQNAIDNYSSEAHVSTWSENDFLSFERTKMYAKDTQRFVVLRGYQENNIGVKDIDFILKGYE